MRAFEVTESCGVMVALKLKRGCGAKEACDESVSLQGCTSLLVCKTRWIGIEVHVLCFA